MPTVPSLPAPVEVINCTSLIDFRNESEQICEQDRPDRTVPIVSASDPSWI